MLTGSISLSACRFSIACEQAHLGEFRENVLRRVRRMGEEKFLLASLFSRPEGSVVKKFSLNLHK